MTKTVLFVMMHTLGMHGIDCFNSPQSLWPSEKKRPKLSSLLIPSAYHSLTSLEKAGRIWPQSSHLSLKTTTWPKKLRRVSGSHGAAALGALGHTSHLPTLLLVPAPLFRLPSALSECLRAMGGHRSGELGPIFHPQYHQTAKVF